MGELEMRNGKRVLVCLDVIKSSKGLPAAGELLSVDAPIPVGREGIVFMPVYPSPGFSGEIRWLRDGNLNECRELSLTKIKEALREEAAEASLAAGAKS